MSITLRAIARDSWRECIALAVVEGQEGFVSANVCSLAQAKADLERVPVALYGGEPWSGSSCITTGRCQMAPFAPPLPHTCCRSNPHSDGIGCDAPLLAYQGERTIQQRPIVIYCAEQLLSIDPAPDAAALHLQLQGVGLS